MKSERDPDGNKITDNYNSEKTEQAKRAGAATSADDLPLGKLGTEGNALGSEARPAKFAEGDDFSAVVSKTATEYTPPKSNLPVSVDPLSSYRKLQNSGGGY